MSWLSKPTLLLLMAVLQLQALLWLCPVSVSAQLLLPGLVLPAIPSGCSVVFAPGSAFSDTATRTSISNSQLQQPLIDTQSSADVNAVAYHLHSSDCGVQLYSTVGGTEDNQQPTTPTFTLNGTAAQSFVVLQPLTPDFNAETGGIYVLTLTASMGGISVYNTATGVSLQVALLNCAAGTFGVQASAITSSSAYSLGPTIPAACAAVGGTPFVDGPSFALNHPGDGTEMSYAVTASGSVQANAVAIHLLGSSYYKQVILSLRYGSEYPQATVLLDAPATGVYAAPLSDTLTLQGNSFSVLLLDQANNPGDLLFGGSRDLPQLQLLYCDTSAFTAQGGSVPAVVCPVSSSTGSSSAVSSSVRSSSALSSSRVSSSARSSSVFSSSAVSSSRVSSSVVSSSAVSSSRVSSSVRSSSAGSSSAVSSSPASSSAVSSSAVSSSAVSSSVPSSSAAASSSSSSSSTSAAAFSDPRFRGFWGQSFYVEGVVGGVYSLLSSQAVQVNARFTYRSNVSCPQQDGHDVSNCFQEAGTYFGSLAVRASTGDWLRVVGGGVAAGFAEVSINGQRPVQVGDSVDVGHTQGQGSGEDTATTTLASTTTTTTTTTTSLPSAETSLRAGPQLARLQQLLRGAGGVEGVDGVDGAAAAGQPHALRSSSPQVQQAAAASSTSPSLPLLHVTRLSARQLRVQAGDYTLHIDNMDGYVDLAAVDVQCWACLEQGHLSLDGLLGQTWQATARIVHDVEGVEQFRVVGDDEAGCSSAVHDRHCSAAA